MHLPKMFKIVFLKSCFVKNVSTPSMYILSMELCDLEATPSLFLESFMETIKESSQFAFYYQDLMHKTFNFGKGYMRG